MALISTDGVVAQKDLDAVYNLLSHLYGPNSHNVMVNNQMISSSSQLFQAVSPSNDVTSLMFSFLKQQLQQYKDGGCFAGLLATCIVQRYLKSGDIPLSVLQDANDAVLKFCIGEIRTSLSWKCNIGRFADVARITRSVLLTKLKLTKPECTHLCLLFARVFTMEDSWRNCHVIKITADGISDLRKSQLEDGLLLRLEKYSMLLPSHKIRRDVRVICFSISIALDSEEMFGDVSLKKMYIETGSSRQLKNDVMDRTLLKTVCSSLVGKVDLVICQKVIHPRVKVFLRDHEIAWVDRLGGSIMPMLSRMCACQPLNNLKSGDNIDRFIGRISTIERLTIEGRFFLKLRNNRPECNLIRTLVLCSRDEANATALETCYEQVLVTLETVSKSEKVVCGGGCTVTQLVMKFILNFEFHDDSLLRRFQPHHLSVYIGALLRLCQAVARHDSPLHHRVDSEHFHHWIGDEDSATSTCCCGQLKKQPGMKFVDFLELQNSLSCCRMPASTVFSANVDDSSAELLEAPTVLVVESEEILVHNLASAFQLANMVLRIGSKVVSSTSTSTD